MTRSRPHAYIIALWAVVVCLALFAYFFRAESLRAQVLSLSSVSLYWRAAAYLAAACLRGFTLVPATYLLVAGLLVLPPLLLFFLTLIGILVSSAAVYFFAGAMRFDRLFERRYPTQVTRLRALMSRRELPIVIAWSFFPLVPTDVICYVCGALRVSLSKCLLGVAIGEGAICGLYIAGWRAVIDGSWLVVGG